MPVRCLTPVALVAALLSAAAGPALAQNQKLRPGLWENRISLKTQGGQFEAAMAQLQQSLASLPPAQRKALEQQMQQQGLGLAGKETVAPSCITPQQADLDSLPQDPACTQTVQRQGLNTLLVTFSCKGSGSTPPSTGEGTITLSGPIAYSGKFKIRTLVDGKPELIDMAQTARWLDADCGKLGKP